MKIRLKTARYLGQGSGGEVFATTLRRGRVPVAVKRLTLEKEMSPRHLQRLRDEAAIIGSLEHENIVKLYDVGSDERGQVCLIMELVDGVHLGRVMGAGPVPTATSVHVGQSLLSALHGAHRAGIVHRDVSPRNVMIGWNGSVKLLDFGIAKEEGCRPTTGGVLRGTMPYLAPEQARSEDVDRRADLFSVGCILYELLAGRPIFRGSYLSQAVVERPPRPLCDVCPSVPPALGDFVMKLLAMRPDERYQTAKAALDAMPHLAELGDGREQLAALMGGHRDAGIFAPPALDLPRPRRWLARVAVLAAVLGLAVAGIYVTAAIPRPATQPEPEPHAGTDRKAAPGPAQAASDEPVTSRPAEKVTTRPKRKRSARRQAQPVAKPVEQPSAEGKPRIIRGISGSITTTGVSGSIEPGSSDTDQGDPR